MKKFYAIFAAIFFATTFAKAADIYKFDPNHVNINWNANHFGFSNPSGKFNEVEGAIILDEKNPKNSSVEVTIKMSSLTTGIQKFDAHLKSSDFFDIEKFPTAKFVSNSVMISGGRNAKISGDFTLHGVTKNITLNARLNKIGLNPFTQKKTIGLSASTVIKRSDFNMNFGLPGVSDNVKIQIETEAILSSSNNSSTAQTPEKTVKISEDSWKIIPAKSTLEFRATQDNSTIKGQFKKFSGAINFNPDKLEKANVEIEVDTTSVETSYSEASETIQNATWLGTKTFPKAIFKAQKFVIFGNAINKQYHVAGTLTLKGKTIPLILEFTLKEFGKTTAHVVGSVALKRSDFGIGDVDLKKSNGVQNDVVVTFDIYAEK